MQAASAYDWPDLVRRCEAVATVEAVYGAGGKRRGGYVRMHCPFHSRDDQSDPKDQRLSIDPATMGFRCFHGACGRSGDALAYLNSGNPVRGADYRRAAVRFADRVGVQVPGEARKLADSADTQPEAPTSGAELAPEPTAAPEREPEIDTDTSGTAKRIWELARAIPVDPSHPARRWAGEGGAKWGVWAASRPWPDAIRWLADGDGNGGRLIACVASLGEWRTAWPDVPVPRAVASICVDSEGRPKRDAGGLRKRTYGPSRGAGVLIADAKCQHGPLYICEGVADALALATWISGPSRAVAERCGDGTASGFAVLGTAGFRSDDVARDLAALDRGAVVCGDRDAAGSDAASALVAAVQDAGGKASTWTLADGFAGGYDPADLALDRAYESAEREAIQDEASDASREAMGVAA